VFKRNPTKSFFGVSAVRVGEKSKPSVGFITNPNADLRKLVKKGIPLAKVVKSYPVVSLVKHFSLKELLPFVDYRILKKMGSRTGCYGIDDFLEAGFDNIISLRTAGFKGEEIEEAFERRFGEGAYSLARLTFDNPDGGKSIFNGAYKLQPRTKPNTPKK
jgi:hypothetical protein